MAMQILIAVAFAADGTVDAEQTLIDAANQVDNFALKYSADREAIAGVVSSVFESFSGTTNKPYVLNQTLQGLKVTAANMATLTEMVNDYLKDNTGKTREEGKLFRTTKGKGGGITLWSRVPIEEPEAKKA